jgi:hypothetical protein
MKAMLLIDHGSVKTEANEMLGAVASMVREMAGPGKRVACRLQSPAIRR